MPEQQNIFWVSFKEKQPPKDDDSIILVSMHFHEDWAQGIPQVVLWTDDGWLSPAKDRIVDISIFHYWAVVPPIAPEVNASASW